MRSLLTLRNSVLMEFISIMDRLGLKSWNQIPKSFRELMLMENQHIPQKTS